MFAATPGSGGESGTAALDPPSDTVVVYGPHRFVTPTGATTVGVESFTIAVQPFRQYLLEVLNGNANGSARPSTLTVELNGSTILTASDLGGAYRTLRVVQALPHDTLRVTLSGNGGDFVDVSVLEVSDGTFAVFGPAVLVRLTGAPQTETFTFAVPGTAGAPFYVAVKNGRPDGSHRTSSATIRLNGAVVVGSGELSQQVGGLVKQVTLQSQNTVEATVASVPASEITLTFLATDVTPPVLTITAPPPNLVTNDATLVVTGTVQDDTPTTVTVNEVVATRNGESYSASVSLTEGSNAIAVSAVDAAGNRTDSSRTVVLDTQAPVLVVDAPLDGFATQFDTILVRGTAADASAYTVSANGVPLPVDGNGSFSGSVSLIDGTNFITVVAADAAGNTTTIVRNGVSDAVAPELAVTEPIDGFTTADEQIAVSGTVVDASPVTLTVNGSTVPLEPNGTFTTSVPLAIGPNTITVLATDAAANTTTVVRSGTREGSGSELPPDPATVAPALDMTVATTTFAATEFLYTGANPIQTGVSVGTINPLRVAVLRGRVLGRDGNPVPGVTISIHGRPEFGQTLTRLDGAFDLVVNGGGVLTVDYRKTGLLPSQRSITAPWQDFLRVDDVVMVALDSQVTVIDFTEPAQVARAAAVTDEDGTRQATLLFKQGTTAAMVLPDGSTQPLSSISVRATEYTVGPAGPRAMPAALPPTSAYTYAAELSADEAIAAGASTVTFSQPVAFYLENFLDLPVGLRMPLAYYDRGKAAWVPMPDGRVIAIVSIDGGVAAIDISGNGTPDDESTLASLGIDNAERVRLASVYAAGTELWRTALTHFTPVDVNLAQVASDPDVRPPEPPEAKNGTDEVEKPDDPCERRGSIIECQTQILGERVALTGTPYTLNYRSDRTPGRTPERELRIPLVGSAVPNALGRIRYRVEVAGQVHVDSVPAAPDQEAVFVWDGKDAYGREVQGLQSATIRIEYVYPAVYATPASDPSFGQPGTGAIAGSPTREELTLSLVQRTTIGSWDARPLGFGGWTLEGHHFYDPIGRVLYLGDGTRRSANSLDDVVHTVAGSAVTGFSGDGGPATGASLAGPNGVTVAPDGSLYIADTFNNRIRRVDAAGIITTVAGIGAQGFGGDGGPATEAMLNSPTRVTVTADGAVYIADALNHRVRRIAPDGTITTVAGTGTSGFSGDGGPAIGAMLNRPHGVVVTPDGAIYVADALNHRVRRIGPDGLIRTVAGTGVAGFSGDDGPGVLARLAVPAGVALGPNGDLYIADLSNDRVRRLTSEGVISSAVGPSAINAGPFDVALGLDGTLYVADINRSTIRQLRPDGRLLLKAGIAGMFQFGGDRGLATRASFRSPNGVAVGPDGNVYVAEAGTFSDGRIRAITPMFTGVAVSDFLVPSEDGSEVYRFSASGQHLATLDAVTGAPRLTFEYESGRLIRVTDIHGNETAIERAPDGTPLAVTGPFGQRTQLALDPDGYLASVANPAGEATQFTYHGGGLMASLTDPKGSIQTFVYDTRGRLAQDNGRADGSSAVVRTDTQIGYEVTLTSTLGRLTRYTMERLPEGGHRRVGTDAAGLISESTVRPDGTVRTVGSDGTTTELTQGPDPRFGMQAGVFTSFTATTPAGLTSTAFGGRQVVLSDQANPFSIVSQLDTIVLNGRKFRSAFDGVTRTFSALTPEGRVSSTRLDSLGRPVAEHVPGLDSVKYGYDERGRLEAVRRGGRETQYSFDGAGRLSAATDALGISTSFQYDSADRVTRLINPGNRIVAFDFDSAGRLISLTPTAKPAHTFTYTADDLVETYRAPTIAGQQFVTTYQYDADRQVSLVIQPDSSEIVMGYDSAGRLSAVTYSGDQTGFTYHPTTGLPQTSTRGDRVLTFSFDGSLPTGTSWSGPVSGTVSRTYNQNFQVASLAVNGQGITHSYDLDGLLTGVGSLTYGYNAANGLLESATQAGIVGRWSYNSHGEVTKYGAVGSDTLFRTLYTRDSLGRITSIEELVAGVASTAVFTYDSLGRLASVSRNGSASAAYAYDDNGNRLSVVRPSGVENGVYDAQDRLVSYGDETYTHSANGTLASRTRNGQTTLFEYDGLGNLTAAILPDGTRIDYMLDALNRRIGIKRNGVLETGFLYQDQLNPVAELDGSGNILSRFVYGARANVPEYMLKGGVTYRIVSDHLGSVRLVVNTSSGTIAQRIDYDEYGQVLLNTNPGFQPLGFAGGVLDDNTQLVLFGARNYEPTVGRWGAKDPIGFRGGSANLYVYVDGDAINGNDPTGEIAPWLVAAAAGALTGAGVDIVLQLVQNRGDWSCIDWGGVGTAFVAGASLSGLGPTGFLLGRGGARAVPFGYSPRAGLLNFGKTRFGWGFNERIDSDVLRLVINGKKLDVPGTAIPAGAKPVRDGLVAGLVGAGATNVSGDGCECR